jgi:hypothetical protein
MAKPSPIVWLPLWERALDSDVEIGIGFKLSGCTREYFKAELYHCRKMAADPRLNDLCIMTPGGEVADEIWICKKTVEIEA